MADGVRRFKADATWAAHLRSIASSVEAARNCVIIVVRADQIGKFSIVVDWPA
jgi:hypothetical protein